MVKNTVMPSTVISAFNYHPGTSTLRVVFVSGTEYEYRNVPEEIYHDMKKAFSKGTFLNKYIKGFYKYTKIS